MYKEYTLARNAYHKALSRAEYAFKAEEIECFVQQATEGNFSSLYKKARQTQTASISLATLETYCRNLFNEPCQPTFPVLPVELDWDNPIMEEISEGEVLQAIEKRRSKGSSLSLLF